MKVGIIGLPQSGKSTLFDCLVASGPPADPTRARIGVAKVPDPRVDALSAIFKPKKTAYASLEFVDFAPPRQSTSGERKSGFDSAALAQMRTADTLLLVTRGFSGGGETPVPRRDVDALVGELVLADLVVAAGRVERLAGDKKRGAKIDERERPVLEKVAKILDEGRPLWTSTFTAEEHGLLRGYALLTLRPAVIVANLDEEGFRHPAPGLDKELVDLAAGHLPDGQPSTVGPLPMLRLCVSIEAEIATLESADDRKAFLADLGLEAPARDRVIRACFAALDLISFFTVGEDEVKAWTITRSLPARQAAGKIHSDLEKGFIRAEVVSYADFCAAGSIAAARSNATLRLEGKDYPVQDGDILNIRFAV